LKELLKCNRHGVKEHKPAKSTAPKLVVPLTTHKQGHCEKKFKTVDSEVVQK
jgi:hypothetical protein